MLPCAVRIAGCFLLLTAALPGASLPKSVAVLWEKPGTGGEVQVDRGADVKLSAAGQTMTDTTFAFSAGAPARLEITLGINAPAELPTLVTVFAAPRPFTFRPDEVTAAHPIYLPSDGVIVTTGNDHRPYADVLRSIQAGAGRTKLQEIAARPEADFAHAAGVEREVKLETWLGIGRDVRLFRMDANVTSFQPRFAGYDTPLPETPTQPATYAFQIGRGWGPRDNLTRSLDQHDLPILRAEIDDEDVKYDITSFASLERSPLTAENIRGTDYLVADAYGHGHMFTPAQKAAEAARHEAEMSPDEEVVLYVRAVATNRGRVPRPAFFKTAAPTLATPISPRLPEWKFEAEHGLGYFASGRVFAVSKLNGQALPAEEVSVLLQPGETATLEFYVPHRPIPRGRALGLAQQSFTARLEEARHYWEKKLGGAARIALPEPRIEEMIRAGLLHLDLVAYGREPRGPLLPAIGVYTAIGSESAPIIQFMDSMGWHENAARALDFFLAKQHDDGFIQNFNGYMLETGAVLWTLGEHYRYTHDDAWLQRVHSAVTKACDYLRRWRERNQSAQSDGNFGLLDGKTADPDDPYRSFMLNGYAYLGLARAAEMLRATAPAEAAEWQDQADALKSDLRRALAWSLERSPVVPLGDGTWSRAAAPWTHYRGPVMLHADGGQWFTHGTMTARDSLLGPLYLAFQEVIAPDEPMAVELLNVHAELMTRDNVAFSQPYYSRHPWLHLRRGEPKAFLQAWYATVAAMADRGTYTFNEHFFPVSAHKTHEEAWFLMETRWMLFLEEGSTLRLLAGVPRAYLAPGAKIAVEKAATYFGPLSYTVTVSRDGKTVHAVIECASTRHPTAVELRLPSIGMRQPQTASGGAYSAQTETMRIAPFTGRAEVTLTY